MRHPFDGVESRDVPRRSALKLFLGAMAGLFGLAPLAAAGPSSRRKPITAALYENGLTHRRGESGLTTVNKEAGAGKPPTARRGEGGIEWSTLALGEEGGSVRKPWPPPKH
jgi:hypothetical protein